MPKFPITAELQQTVETHPKIEAIHFTEDGHYHFRVFPYKNDFYTRLNEVPAKTTGGLTIPNKFELVPFTNNKNEPLHRIAETLTREQVLSATPVNAPATNGLTKGDVLNILGITDEDFAKVLSTKNKK